MRVIAGKARRHNLKTIEGMGTRPTTDRIKETLFNLIQNDIEDKVVLDLFSGSGAIGIEFLSRYAEKAYFVEENKECVKVINENLEHTKLIEAAEVLNVDVDDAIDKIAKSESKVDIIFMDPPYDKNYINKTLKKIEKCGILDENGIIIIESSPKEEFEFPEGMEIYKEKNFKTTKITILARY